MVCLDNALAKIVILDEQSIGAQGFLTLYLAFISCFIYGLYP